MFSGFASSSGYIQVINLFLFDWDATIIFILVVFILIEWLGREETFSLSAIRYLPFQKVRWFTYLILVFSVFHFYTTDQQFIYFQF
jgi:hypothetical protein